MRRFLIIGTVAFWLVITGCDEEPPTSPSAATASAVTSSATQATDTPVPTATPRPIAGYPPSPDEDSICTFTRRSTEELHRHDHTYISALSQTAVQPGSELS